MIRYLICAILSAVILLGSSNLYSQTTSATVDLSFIIDDTNLEEESDSELPTFSDPKDRDKYAPADPCLEYILSTTNIIRDTTINGNSNVRAIYQGHFLGCNYDSITYTQDWYRVSEYGFGNGPDWNPTYYNSSQTVIRHAGCTYEYDTITTEQNWISRRVNTSVYFDNATVIDCDTIYEDLTFNCDTIKSIQYTKDPNADAITVYINAKVSLDAITTERPLETLTHIPTQLNAEWYSITVPNCEKFEMNIPLPDGSTCGPIFIYSPCEHFPEEEPEILADCDDFDYSIAASSDIVIIRSNSESDSNYCAINWSFPDTITDSDIVIRTENELFDIDYSILGLNGVFVAEDSSNVTIDFFYEANGEEYFCSKELFVTCPDSTATIDSSELDKFIDCSLIQVNTQGSYCYKNEIVGCKLQWTVPEDYNPIVQIVGNNPKNISSNEGEVFIDGDGVNVLMTISYFDEEFGNGWITRTCDLGHFYCDNTTDSDGDGVTDDIDNCIYTANPNQYDNDQDGIGDACELDLDGDGVLDDNDNNIYAANPLQEDLNGDGIGDIGSDGIDSDGDGIPNHLDNCIYTPNPDQEDLNGDGIGNVCEKDTDGDGVLDDVDNCIGLHNPDQIDRNEDGVGDACQSENSCTPIILQKDNLCAVFNSIQFLEVGTTLDNVLLAGPDNIDQALETSNLSKEDYLLNLSVVNSVKVSYIIKLINSGEYSNIIPIFEKISYTDLNKFKFEEWGEYIEIPDDHVGQGFYTVEIEDINGTTISCSTLPFNIDTEVIEVDPEIEINLPTLECGVDPNNPTNMITDPQTELYVGNIVFMNGFPITISDITSSNSSSTGHYTGSGIMPLPFGNQKYVLLTLANIQVNRNNVIISGTVEEKANTTVLNNLLGVNVSTTWVVGDNYCVPPENVPSSTTSTNSSTNNNGTGGTNPGTFGPGGTHSGTGTNYDWNGYDSNGIHYATQDTINEFGCTQDGYNIHTQQYDCDPGQPYTEIDEYITSIGPALAITVDSSLQALFDSLELKIGNLSCDSLRTVMGTTMSQIKSNQNFNDTPLFDDLVKGEQSEYFNENLSEAFASPLTKPLVNQEQGPLIKTLENNHFDLYQCDLLSVSGNYYSDALSDPAIKQEIIDSILDEMRKWTSYQATVIYENETKLQEFIHLMVKKYFEENSDIGFNNNLQEQNINIEESINDIFNFKNSPYFSTASNDNNLYITNFSGEKLEAAKFEFDQGFDQIGGVHRAFFLEKIHELQSSNTSPLTTTSSFPIKIPYSSGSYIYELYLDNLYLTPTTTKIDAYLIVKSNTSDQKIVLQAEDVIITSSGIQSATLKLKSNVDVKLNNVTLLKLKKNVTEVTWTCSGFDSFKIGADVEFCNLYVTPLDAALEPESGSLVVSITGEGSDWMEFYVDMTANKSFALTKYPEYKFTIPKIVFDFDSQNNATSFPVVVGYDSNHLDPLGRLANSWKGVYINQLNVQIPDQITGSSIVGNIFFDHVLIDGRGFSGSMSYKKEILSLEDGSKGGWGFSIDKLGIVILHQHMAGFSMGGQVEMPLFKGEFDYIASLTTENEYQMTIQNRTDVEMPLLIAEATLDDFRATANYDGSDFQFTVHASGVLELKQSDLTSKLKNMPKLKFSEVIIQNYGKKLDAGDWSIVGGPNSDSKINFLGMELGFKTVKGSKAIKIEERENDETAIPLSVSATFLESIGLEISGEVSIIGYYDDVTDPKLHKWRFKKIGIDGVGACITSIPGAEEARICVTLTEDANGNPVFRGDGTATFGRDKLKIKASVVGEFGWNGDDKYFFVDGLAELDPGLMVPPILFKGFGGGLSYNMQFDFDPASIDWTANLSDPPTELGSTFSGGTYTFNNSAGLGFSAMTLFEMAGSAGLLNGSLLLNFNFHGGNGFTMKIIGLAQMMANFDVNNIPVLGNVANELDRLGDNRLTSWLSEQDEKPPGIPLGGYIYLEVVNGALTGKLKVFLDAYGILEGRQNYEVVDADLYFAGFNDWFINIGKPSKAAGMKFNAAGVLKADVFGYFNAGTNLPDYSYEYLPSKIRNFVRNNVKISDALRNSGAGIMFGLGFEIGANVSIGIASAEASAGAGFDIMIRKYKDASCLGSTGELGIDGWYAMGQVWAFVEGSLRVFGLEVINAGLYAVMNAQLPNPTFVQAAMKIKFKFLFKRFTKTMRITMGEQCIIESNDPNDIVGIDVITMIDPFRGTESLPVNTSANVFYALPLNKKIEETNVSFEVKNEQVKLYNSQGFQLDYQLERNIEGNETKIIPTVMLPENDSITIIVSVDVYKDNIFVVTQSDTSYFYTSERFLDIPLSNIEYSYPLDDMYNLYPYEGAITSSEPIGPLSGIDGTFGAPGATVVEGFIKLKQGQPDILLNIEEGYSQLVKFTDQNGDYFLVPAQYDAYNTQIDYLLPSDLLISESIYKLDFGLFKDGVWDADVAIPDNTIATINEFLSDDQGNTGQSNSLPDELILASLHFRVSSFGTFIEKIDDIKLNGTFSTPTNSSVPTINSIPIQSSIDYVEIFGNSVYDDALIRIKSSSNYNPDMFHSLFSRPYEVYKSEIISRTSACNDLETFFESQKEEELWKSKLIGLNTNSLHKLSGANEQASSNIQVIKYTYDKYASDTYERATAKISQCGSPYLEKLARDLAKKAINTQSPDADCCSQNISLASRNLDELTWCNIDNEECVWEKGMDLYLHQGLINWHLNGAGPTKPPSSSEFHLSLSYHIPGGKKTSTAVIWFNN